MSAATLTALPSSDTRAATMHGYTDMDTTTIPSTIRKQGQRFDNENRDDTAAKDRDIFHNDHNETHNNSTLHFSLSSIKENINDVNTTAMHIPLQSGHTHHSSISSNTDDIFYPRNNLLYTCILGYKAAHHPHPLLPHNTSSTTPYHHATSTHHHDDNTHPDSTIHLTATTSEETPTINSLNTFDSTYQSSPSIQPTPTTLTIIQSLQHDLHTVRASYTTLLQEMKHMNLQNERVIEKLTHKWKNKEQLYIQQLHQLQLSYNVLERQHHDNDRETEKKQKDESEIQQKYDTLYEMYQSYVNQSTKQEDKLSDQKPKQLHELQRTVDTLQSNNKQQQQCMDELKYMNDTLMKRYNELKHEIQRSQEKKKEEERQSSHVNDPMKVQSNTMKTPNETLSQELQHTQVELTLQQQSNQQYQHCIQTIYYSIQQLSKYVQGLYPRTSKRLLKGEKTMRMGDDEEDGKRKLALNQMKRLLHEIQQMIQQLPDIRIPTHTDIEVDRAEQHVPSVVDGSNHNHHEAVDTVSHSPSTSKTNENIDSSTPASIRIRSPSHLSSSSSCQPMSMSLHLFTHKKLPFTVGQSTGPSYSIPVNIQQINSQVPLYIGDESQVIGAERLIFSDSVLLNGSMNSHEHKHQPDDDTTTPIRSKNMMRSSSSPCDHDDEDLQTHLHEVETTIQKLENELHAMNHTHTDTHPQRQLLQQQIQELQQHHQEAVAIQLHHKPTLQHTTSPTRTLPRSHSTHQLLNSTSLKKKKPHRSTSLKSSPSCSSLPHRSYTSSASSSRNHTIHLSQYHEGDGVSEGDEVRRRVRDSSSIYASLTSPQARRLLHKKVRAMRLLNEWKALFSTRK